MFPVTSRYHNIETATMQTSGAGEIIYLRRRFLPPAARSIAAAEHTVTQGERLDNITAQQLGDPEQFWRLCDANNAMQPDGLTAEEGRRLIVPVIQ